MLVTRNITVLFWITICFSYGLGQRELKESHGTMDTAQTLNQSDSSTNRSTTGLITKGTMNFTVDNVTREHVTSHKNIIKNVSEIIKTTSINSDKTSNIVDVGKLGISKGKEPIVELPSIVPTTHRTTGRKGVGTEFSNDTNIVIGNSSQPTFKSSLANTTITTTTTTLRTDKPIKKPIITEPSNPVIETSKEVEAELLVADVMLDNKPKKPDYIVPIFAVILSVPLVAILFTVLYKRGVDWWQHRNYRRMDFLIEGMYNN